MKTFTLSMLFFVFFGGKMFCQNNHQIKVGVGFMSVLLWKTQSQTPYFFVDYRYPLSEVVHIGLQTGYTTMSQDLSRYSVTPYGFNLIEGTEKNKIFIVMPGIDVRYFKSNNFSLYGNANFGVGFETITNTFNDPTEKRTEFTLQVNPIGLKYGNKVSAFLEAGIGINILNAGINVSL